MSKDRDSCVENATNRLRPVYWGGILKGNVRRVLESSKESLAAVSAVRGGQSANPSVCRGAFWDVVALEQLAGDLHGLSVLARASGQESFAKALVDQRNILESQLTKLRQTSRTVCMSSADLRKGSLSGVRRSKKKATPKKTTCRIVRKKVGGRVKSVRVCSPAPKRKPAKKKAKR
jgi:hypothetical protein